MVESGTAHVHLSDILEIESIKACQRQFMAEFVVRKSPENSSVQYLVNKLKTTGKLLVAYEWECLKLPEAMVQEVKARSSDVVWQMKWEFPQALMNELQKQQNCMCTVLLLWNNCNHSRKGRDWIIVRERNGQAYPDANCDLIEHLLWNHCASDTMSVVNLIKLLPFFCFIN